MLRPALVVLLVSTAIAASPSALASAQVISRPRAHVARPSLAVGADGTRALAWIQTSPGVAGPRVMLALAPPHKPFGAPRQIGSTSASVGSVAVGVTPHGTTLMLWTAENPPVPSAPVVLYAASIGRRQAVIAPVQLSLPGSTVFGAPVLAVGAGGRAAAAWTSEYAATGRRIDVASFDRHRFGAAVSVPDSGPLPDVGPIGVDVHGAVTVTWAQEAIDCGDIPPPCVPQPAQVQAAFMVGGVLGPRQVVSPPAEEAGGAVLGEAPNGRAALVWVTDTGDGFTIGGAVRPAGQPAFAPARNFAGAPTGDSFRPLVALAGNGAGRLVWEVRHVLRSQLLAAPLDRIGGVGRVDGVPGSAVPGDVQAPALAVAGNGAAVLAWVSGTRLLASTSLAGRRFAKPRQQGTIPVGGAEGNVAVVAGPRGIATLAYVGGQGDVTTLVTRDVPLR